MLAEKYTMNWNCITHLVQPKDMPDGPDHALFMLRTSLCDIWRERNRRKHGEAESPHPLLIKNVDKKYWEIELSHIGCRRQVQRLSSTQQSLILFFQFHNSFHLSFSLSMMLHSNATNHTKKLLLKKFTNHTKKHYRKTILHNNIFGYIWKEMFKKKMKRSI